MGKDKTGQRRKGNAKPSSSGRSAEMLGSAPINPFMSFSTLKENFGKDDASPDPILDPNFQLVLKKMNKKDSLTKLKALQEFHQLCQNSEAEAVVAILPFWPRLYSTLSLDTDHRIREATQLAHSGVLSQVKRNIAPYLKPLSGPWFVAQCDTYAPAATVACKAFRETFPEEKLSKAIAHCQDEILNYIIENLLNHTPQTLCNSKTMSTEEMESKFLRTITSSLQGYSLYLSQLTTDQLMSARELNRKLVCDQKFWKYGKHQSPHVRCAWFRTIISLCQNAQFVLDGEEKHVALAVFNSLDENEAIVLPVVWEAALVALVTLDGLWEAVSFNKLVLPKLFRVCREAGYGCATVIFPSLLPLLSKIPQHIHNDVGEFYSKLFDSIRAGFPQRSVQQSSSESKAVASTFMECLQYVIQQHQSNEDLCFALLHQHLLPLVISSLIEPHWKAHVCDALYSSLSKLLHVWGRSPEGSIFQKLLGMVCSEFSKSLKEIIVHYISPTDKDNSSENFEGKVECPNPTRVLTDQGSSHEGESPKVKKSLSSLLKSQVNFIIQLLRIDARPQRVKFDDESVGNSTALSRGQTESCEATIEKISAVGSDLCSCYLILAKTSENVDFLPPLVSLLQTLHSLPLFSAMARAVDLSSERELFPQLLSSWLKPDSAFVSRSVVTFSSLLLRYLPLEDQTQLLDSILQHNLNPTCLLWVVEEGVSSDGTVASWVRSPQLTEPMRRLTENAVLCQGNDPTWTLLCKGAEVAKDGDHVLCCEVLREAIHVILKSMEAFCSTEESLPPWLSHAVAVLQKLFVGHTPFFASLPDPYVSLSVFFKVSLFVNQDAPEAKSILTVWRNSIETLASVHGPTSPPVLILCSLLRKHVQMLLFQKDQMSLVVPLRISSHLSDFIITLSNSCVDEYDEERKADTCSLLMNELFCQSELSDSDHDLKESDEPFACLQAQKSSLQMLASWVHPKSDITSMKGITPDISESQMDLVALGYWGTVMISVIEKVADYCSVISKTDTDPRVSSSQSNTSETDTEPCVSSSQSNTNKLLNGVCSMEIFMDSFLLLSDIKCVVCNYLSTEVGSALQQPYSLMAKSFSRTLELMCESLHEDLHNLFSERARNGVHWSRAHDVWHTMSSTSQDCSTNIPSIIQAPPDADSFSDNVDLSPLELLTEKISVIDSDSSVRSIASEWLCVIHRLHMLHSQRLLLSGNMSSASPSSILDAYRVMAFLGSLITHSPEILEGRNWDQVMVAVASWIHSSHESITSSLKNEHDLQPSAMFCIHLRGACRLFVALNKVLANMQDGTLKLEGLSESLPREWGDVFAGECEHKLLAIWTIFVENIHSSASPLIVATLDELGLALQHSTLAFLVPSKGAPVKYQPLLDLAPPFLLHSLGSVRLAAYHLLLKVVPHMVKSDAEMLAAVTSKVESGDIPLEYAERLTLPGFEDTLVPTQTVVSALLSDIRLGSTCTVQPFTDAYTYTSGYLLVWSLMLEMCKVAETELRYQYAIWMKNASSNFVEMLLNNVFRLLPDKVLRHSEGKKKTSIDVFTKKPSFAFQDCWSSTWIESLACSVLLEAMGRLPALARQWWKDCEPKAATLIERVVSEYLSPTLCAEEMAAVAKMQDKAVDNMVVRVHPAVREVVATYTVDDVAMELVVRLPSNHPLSPMVVDIGKRDSGSTSQWRQWLMQLTMFLTHQNGSLWDGLALWRNNVVRRYEGVEECYVCYCVLSGPNLQLPKLSCRTCRKKFHSNCLYKWFQTSNKSTCPICRNLF